MGDEQSHEGEAEREQREKDEEAIERSEGSSAKRWNHDATRAIAGGAVAILIGAGTVLLLGFASPFEARNLLESATAVLPYYASAGIGGGTTVLALMLTVIGIGARAERAFDTSFYRRALWIGRQASLVFVCSVLLLLVLAAPVGSADENVRTLTVVQWYATASLTAILGGLYISLILMLQSTLSDIIMVVGLGVEDHYAVASSSSDSG